MSVCRWANIGSSREICGWLSRSDALSKLRRGDTNYIFLTFVTQHLPAGLVGLVLAVVFGATMTSLSAEMSALATVTVVHIYQRHVRTDATDHRYLTASRGATVFWGVYAIVCAQSSSAWAP